MGTTVRQECNVSMVLIYTGRGREYEASSKSTLVESNDT